MLCASFSTATEAAEFRKVRGGHLFVPEKPGLPSWWFDASAYTITGVMLHPAILGMRGTVNPTDTDTAKV